MSLAYTLDSRKLEDVRNVAIEIRQKVWYTVRGNITFQRSEDYHEADNAVLY